MGVLEYTDDSFNSWWAIRKLIPQHNNYFYIIGDTHECLR